MKTFLVLVILAGTAAAQPAGSAGSGSAAGSAASAAPVAVDVAPIRPADPQPPASAEQLRKICSDAMNADPTFAKSIAETVDKQIDQKTIDAHLDAEHHIQKNKAHVLYAYAAMWVIAALFVIFLWRRQQGLKAEIAQLKKDLDAKEAK